MTNEESHLVALSIEPKNELGDIVNLHLICRICANQSDNLIHIYSEDGINNGLANKMNLYLPIKVSNVDTLPLHCCWQCASTVLAWHDLVVTSTEADRRLRSYQIEAEQQLQVISSKINKPNENLEDTDLSKGTITFEHIEEDPVCENEVGIKFSDQEVIPEDKICERLFSTDCDLTQVKENTREYEDEIFFEQKDVTDDNEKEESIVSDKQGKGSRRYAVKHMMNKPQQKIDEEVVNKAKLTIDGRIFYKCEDCGKTLHSKYTFAWHMRIHTGERPYVCDLCGKQFRVSQGLVRHLKETHERIKNFECDLCGRYFSTKRNVEEHRRIHTNERPYVCSICEKSFKQKASLFVHNRSHSTEFPFPCTYCSQKFRTKQSLITHITRHTGEKPFPCDICERRFRIKYELKRHKLVHSEEKPFSCKICKQTFRQKRYLRNHLKLNHDIANPNEQIDDV